MNGTDDPIVIERQREKSVRNGLIRSAVIWTFGGMTWTRLGSSGMPWRACTTGSGVDAPSNSGSTLS